MSEALLINSATLEIYYRLAVAGNMEARLLLVRLGVDCPVESIAEISNEDDADDGA